MLTVKHEAAWGANFWETDHVEYYAGNSGKPQEVMFRPVGADHFETLSAGSIYIMNGAGKTVQQYHFIPSAKASEEDGVIRTGAGSASIAA